MKMGKQRCQRGLWGGFALSRDGKIVIDKIICP